MKEEPLISVIVPVYNVEKYLDRCVNSIVNQTYTNIEILLIDDGSPDNCPTMCDEWTIRDNRIITIHQDNKGLSSARNTGIKNSNGEYLTFVDSDDWISLTMVEDLYKLASKYTADISVCNFIKTDRLINVLNDLGHETIYNQNDFMKIILKVTSNRTIHYAWAKLYRKEIIDDEHYPVGMLNEDVEGMFKAVIRSNLIAETSKIGYFYYENRNSISRRTFGENFMNLVEVWSRIFDISSKYAPKYLEYVVYNSKRINFTILCDSIIFGSKKSDKTYSLEIKEFLKKLRMDIPYLLKSPMKANRKFLSLLIAYNYYPIRFFYRLFRNKQLQNGAHHE